VTSGNATSREATSRVAGVLVILVGLLNLGLGLLSLVSDQIRLGTGVAGGLVVAGLVTASLGVLVWRGSQNAAILATAVFGALLIFQVSELFASGPSTSSDAIVDDPAPRLVVLGVLVIACGVAAWRLSRRPSTPPGD
jgi:hypothetical protein